MGHYLKVIIMMVNFVEIVFKLVKMGICTLVTLKMV